MNYKEKFEDFLNRMTGLLDEANKKGHIIVRVEDLENAFPELKESEDEKIRKELLDYCKNRAEKYPNDPKYKNIGAWIAWLEKQGEQKHADKVKPKFHEGEWVVYECGGETATLQITRIVEETYEFSDDSTLEVVDEDTLRLWTIQDAKDGDVLACNEEILLLKSYSVQNRISLYCWYNGQTNNFHSKEVVDTLLTTRNKICPATKEQRGLLFQKMKEAGYEWDAEKKELKKIENEIEIPFGAKDSELQEATYYIPKGFHAEIDSDKVVIKKGEKPAEWSEEDEENFRDILRAIHDVAYQTSEDEKARIDWLKSLKFRKGKVNAQKPAEWSEEDERMYRGLHKLIYSTPYCDSRKEFSDWLNSIRPRIMGLK